MTFYPISRNGLDFVNGGLIGNSYRLFVCVYGEETGTHKHHYNYSWFAAGSTHTLIIPYLNILLIYHHTISAKSEKIMLRLKGIEAEPLVNQLLQLDFTQTENNHKTKENACDSLLK